MYNLRQALLYSNLFCIDTLIQKLLPLGFTRATIRKELVATDGDLNEAANNLLSQLPDVQAQGVLASMKKEDKNFSIKSVEVKMIYMLLVKGNCLCDNEALKFYGHNSFLVRFKSIP